MNRRNRKKESKGSPRWMVTYSDMVTLILVFFILLFSMSQIDSMKFKSITESFQDRNILDFISSKVPTDDPSGGDQGIGMENEDPDDAGSGDDKDVNDIIDQLEEWEKKADALARLMDDVDQFLDEEGLGDEISATRTEEGVILVLQDSILFDPGEAIILEDSNPFLDKVAELLSDISNNVRVEGHTDTMPMNSYRYPSNWELSGARAAGVVRYFVEENDLDSDRFLIAGYSDTRPVDGNPDNLTKNRRVEIVVLDESHDQANND